MHELIEQWRREAVSLRKVARGHLGTLRATYLTEANTLASCADELEQALLRNRAEVIAVTDSRANTWTRQDDGSWTATLAQPLVAGDTITLLPQ